MTQTVRHVLASNSAGETIAAGVALGSVLGPGDVVALTGELGSGKTVFTKGVAAGLGFELSNLVTSPTYKVLNQYQGRVTINHFDAYRLNGPGDFADIGGDDLLGGTSVSVIEWAERVAQVLPPWTVTVVIQVLSSSGRELEITFPESRKELAGVFAGLSPRDSESRSSK